MLAWVNSEGIATATDICRTLQKLKGLSDTVSDGKSYGDEMRLRGI